MNFIDKVGSSFTQSIDFIIDKNRQQAQLNRIKALIQSETDTLNRAYIALGKQYYKMLEENAEEVDVSSLRDTIRTSRLRLKKAKARYEYILKYGVPTPNRRDDLSVACIEQEEEKCSKDAEEEKTACDKTAETPCEEEQDITIAYADPDKKAESVEEKIEKAAEALQEKAENAVQTAEEKVEKVAETVEEKIEKAAETAKTVVESAEQKAEEVTDSEKKPKAKKGKK